MPLNTSEFKSESIYTDNIKHYWLSFRCPEFLSFLVVTNEAIITCLFALELSSANNWKHNYQTK